MIRKINIIESEEGDWITVIDSERTVLHNGHSITKSDLANILQSLGFTVERICVPGEEIDNTIAML